MCLYTLQMIANHLEGTFGPLRYILEGTRPKQTARLALFSAWIHRSKLEPKYHQGGISLMALSRLAPELQSLPPMLHKQHSNSIPECSEGSGVFSSWCGKTASSPPLQFRRVSLRDSAQLVTPFVRVGTYPTRNFAQLIPLCFQRGWTISLHPLFI